MWEKAGLLREASQLQEAQGELGKMRTELPGAADRVTQELRNLHTVGELIVNSALAREESRGAHYRLDFPGRDDERYARHSVVRKGESSVEFEPAPVHA
jgi:L-aspartate oxidase